MSEVPKGVPPKDSNTQSPRVDKQIKPRPSIDRVNRVPERRMTAPISDGPVPDLDKDRSRIPGEINEKDVPEQTPQTQRESVVLEGTIMQELEPTRTPDHPSFEVGDDMHVEFLPDEKTYVIERRGSEGVDHVRLVLSPTGEIREEDPAEEPASPSKDARVVFPEPKENVQDRPSRESASRSSRESKRPKEKFPKREAAFSVNVDKVLAGSHGEKEGRLAAAVEDCLNHNEGVALKTKGGTGHLEQTIVRPLVEGGIDPRLLRNLTIIGEQGGARISFDDYGEMRRSVDDSMRLPEETKRKVREMVAEKYSDVMKFVTGLETMVEINAHDDADRGAFQQAQKELRRELQDVFAPLRAWRRIRQTRNSTVVRHNATGRRLEKKRLINWLLGKDAS